MPRHIVRLEDNGREWWLEWSTVVDAPVTHGMSEAEFREYYEKEYRTTDGLDARMGRARETGTSSLVGTLAGFFALNRAGLNDESLTREEIISVYCLGDHID